MFENMKKGSGPFSLTVNTLDMLLFYFNDHEMRKERRKLLRTAAVAGNKIKLQ